MEGELRPGDAAAEHVDAPRLADSRCLLYTSGSGRPSAVGRRLWAVVLLAGLLYTTVATTRDYFVVWAADPDLPAHFQANYRAIGEAIGRLDAAQPVWLSPFPADHPVIQLHAGLRLDLRAYNGRLCLPYSDPIGERGMTYVIVPGLQLSLIHI